MNGAYEMRPSGECAQEVEAARPVAGADEADEVRDAPPVSPRKPERRRHRVAVRLRIELARPCWALKGVRRARSELASLASETSASCPGA